LASAFTDISEVADGICVPKIMNEQTSNVTSVSARAEGTVNNFQVGDEHGIVS